MMSYNEVSEIFGEDIAKSLGFSDEQFLSLPDSYQRALVKCYLDVYGNKNNKSELQKRLTLRQANLEEKIKKKIKSLFME